MTSAIDLVRGGFAGKSIGRIIFNDMVKHSCADMHGRVLDLAGGEAPGYLALLPTGIELVRTNRVASADVGQIDFNEPLPFEDSSFDAVLLFNAIYIARDPSALMGEIARIMKQGGVLYMSSPFIANEMPEPHDYVRFTAEGLERLCRSAGFTDVSIERVGERGSAAMTLLAPFLFFNVMRGFAYPWAILFDKLVPDRIRKEHPCPMSYFVVCTK